MELHIAFQNEFFQGDLVRRICLGVFSSPENADECIMDLEANVQALFDPMIRVSFEVIPTYLDEPLYEEDA
ncbi:MAG: hypothetical protein ACXADH_05695 [Candidatus Kariarchaeaceae archaeon]